MEIANYPLMCYWNGEIVEENGCVGYRGGSQCFVNGNSRMTFDDLMKEICEGMSVESMGTQLNVKMKYPSYGSFKVVPMNKTRDLWAMWASVRHSKTPSVDLYIEMSSSKFTQPSNIRSSLPMTPPTNIMSSLPMTLDNVGQYVSLETNDVNEGIFDGNLEGDEAEYEVELMNFGEDEDDDEYLVGINAPIGEFNKVYDTDEQNLNSWITWENTIQHKKGEEFAVGQNFPNKGAVIDVVTVYSIQKNQLYKVAESKPHTITFKCGRKPNPCTWRLRASKREGHSKSFTIVTYIGPHQFSCVGDTIPRDHTNLKRGFISGAIRNLVEVDWGIRICLIIEFMKDKFNYIISYNKAWNAKQGAIADIFGDWEKSYEILPQFMQALKESNPGTIVQFCTTPSADPDVQFFQRVFWAFKPSIDGFVHCRPIITIDGTFLYGKYKGTMLTAMGVDPNNQIFPLAFAIVESENGESWPWFMACIRAFVTQRTGLCVISDRHAGIMKAMSEIGSQREEPYAYHRVCIRHLASNVNTKFTNRVVKNLFGSVAMQNQKKKFDHLFNRLGDINVEARRYVADIGLDKWSIFHDGGYRYGLLTTNVAESFNNVLKGARFLPITSLVKCTFYRVNAYFVARREWAKERILHGHRWSEKITRKMNENCEKAAHHKVIPFDQGEGIFQVTTGRGGRSVGKGNNTHTVNLFHRTCTCNKIQVYKYPCSHLYAICRSMSVNIAQYVDIFYTSGKHLASYAPKFQPIPDEAYWTPYNGPKIICNVDRKRGKGRPVGKRFRNEMDDKSGSQVTCSLCRGRGHNNRTCPKRPGCVGQPKKITSRVTCSVCRGKGHNTTILTCCGIEIILGVVNSRC